MPATNESILDEADFKRVSDMVYRYCGINLHDGKKSLVQARVAKQLRAGGFTTIGDYLDHVVADASGREFALLIDAMSTNLTSFYREADHFRYLADTVLPEAVARKVKKNESQLRVWSAGCSTGEEPYTLAMLMHDTVPNIGEWDAKILATDISTHVLGVARQAFYSKARLEPLPPSYRTRFFRTAAIGAEKGFTVAPELRDMIAFRRLNLIQNWPFNGPFDFIFCRNVMIYFDKATQQRLVNRFHDVLAPGGVLFTGHSESLTGISHPFRFLRPTVYGKA